MLEERVTTLKTTLIEYATHVESMIEKSVKGLLQKDQRLLIEVIEQDEPRANNWEIELEEACTHMIAQFQPVARDLRTILMVFEITGNLERMADHAVNIAESALYLIERPQVKPLIDTPRMAEEVVGMVKDSLQSFIDGNAKLAKSVCERDDIVDGLANQILRELITYMSADPSTIERSLHLLDVAGNLERVADLSTNIGENVIFMVEGKVIKHHHEDDQQIGRT